MEIIGAGFLTLLSLIAWIGQLVYAVSPRLGAKLGIGEAEADVDEVFYIDARGEAIWDSFILWMLPVAGILIMFSNPLWVYFGLIGGGAYVYFSGRNLITRILMQHNRIQIGNSNNIKIAYLFLTLWGVSALVTIVIALETLVRQ